MFGFTLGERERDPQVQGRRFDRIARRYDLVNAVASLGCSVLWTRAFCQEVARTAQDMRQNAPHGMWRGAHDDAKTTESALSGAVALSASQPLAGLRVLDVACGTGDVTRALAALGATVTGCDISQGMLDCARCRDAALRAKGNADIARIDYRQGDAQALEFPDASFDVVTCCYGLRNMPSPTGALAQMHRVLRPGGAVVTMDFDMPGGLLLPNLYRVYNAFVLPLIGGLLTGHPGDYQYLADSIEQWPGRRGVAHMMQVAGLLHCGMKPIGHGFVSLNRGFAAA